MPCILHKLRLHCNSLHNKRRLLLHLPFPLRQATFFCVRTNSSNNNNNYNNDSNRFISLSILIIRQPQVQLSVVVVPQLAQK